MAKEKKASGTAELPDGAIKKLGATFESVKFEKAGDTFEGVYFDRKVRNIKGKARTLYHFRAKTDGKPRTLWGSATIDRQMEEAGLGQTLRVVYIGEGDKKSGQNAVKLFDIFLIAEAAGA